MALATFAREAAAFRHRATRLAQGRPALDAGATVAAINAIEVVVMAGSHGAGGIAPALRSYPQLSRPPFSAFSQIDLVSRAQLSLSEQAPAVVAIPNGGSIRVSLAGGARGRRASVAVTITLGGRTHQTQYSVVPGDPFFLVHSTGVDSALIVRFVPTATPRSE